MIRPSLAANRDVTPVTLGHFLRPIPVTGRCPGPLVPVRPVVGSALPRRDNPTQLPGPATPARVWAPGAPAGDPTGRPGAISEGRWHG